MIPEEYEYSDPGLSSRVNDFGDEYHLPDDDEANQEKSILKDVKRLKRRYRNFGEYCEAMRLYQNYCNDLIDKYGGKKRFRFALAIGMVKEYIPFKPEIRNDKRNKPYIKGGEIWLNDKDEHETSYIESDISPIENPDISLGIDNDKGISKLLGNNFIMRKKISQELDAIDKFYSGKVKHPTRMTKRAQKRKILMKKYTKQSESPITDKLRDYDERLFMMYDVDEDDPDKVIMYKDVSINQEQADEIEADSALRNMGINLNRHSLSKKSRKVVRRNDKKKKKKSKNKTSDKWMKKFTNGEYDTFDEFERNMQELVSNGLRNANK